ncbi:hypothetical protein M407DRAFT_244246 [Tulasnella calospora MUT 4182]|uniref:Paired domain-containing protein n=1 Tax=Tulasnella calospora MUT 4182 TaxID=1051891 RepID=A0A0C3LU76_9AGAM|nr:hypothetical protein M407DRAFT_244246 [Tulasnella calospora MUT 4182]
MGRQLTSDERWTIVRLRYDEDKPISYIVDKLNTSQSTVYLVLAEFHHTGQTSNPKPSGRGTSRILTQDDIGLVRSMLKQSPSVFLDEVQDALEEEGRQVSLHLPKDR